jgi:hypothetical protein
MQGSCRVHEGFMQGSSGFIRVHAGFSTCNRINTCILKTWVKIKTEQKIKNSPTENGA